MSNEHWPSTKKVSWFRTLKSINQSNAPCRVSGCSRTRTSAAFFEIPLLTVLGSGIKSCDESASKLWLLPTVSAALIRFSNPVLDTTLNARRSFAARRTNASVMSFFAADETDSFCFWAGRHCVRRLWPSFDVVLRFCLRYRISGNNKNILWQEIRHGGMLRDENSSSGPFVFETMVSSTISKSCISINKRKRNESTQT